MTGSDIAAGPRLGRRRVQAIDALRGFALFGIIIVNVYWFAIHPGDSDGGMDGRADAVVSFLVDLLAGGKFMCLFAFLFGVGFAVQMEGSGPGGGGITRAYWRRLGVLAVFGMLHAWLLSPADVLLHYALLGSLLPLLSGRSDRFLLRLVALLMIANMLMSARHLEEGGRAGLHGVEQAYTSGGFWRVAEARLIVYRGLCRTTRHTFGWHIFAMFLLGIIVWRRGILRDPAAHRGLLWITLIEAGILGLVCNLVFACVRARSEEVTPWVYMIGAIPLHVIGAPLLMLSYGAALTLFSLTRAGRVLLTPLALMGRMALTNYILQSVAMGILFMHYGLGWHGRYGVARATMIAALIFAAQAPVSMVWLAVFRFGPLEWLWRTLTYLQWQPILRRREIDPPAPPPVACPVISAEPPPQTGPPFIWEDVTVEQVEGGCGDHATPDESDPPSERPE